MVALAGFSFIKACRSFGTSSSRFVRFQPPVATKLVRVGRFQSSKSDKQYEQGQLFLHKAYAYRGIILCSFNCKVYNRPRPDEVIGFQDVIPYYQVLIHKDDWEFMGFPYDITSYLGQGGNREDKVMNIIHGMDCVAHNEILPYCILGDEESEKPPIDHDLFDKFFEHCDEGELEYKIRCDITPLHLVNQSFWLVPQAVYKEVNENVEVQVMTYYLGTNVSKGQLMHCWRYVTRVQNFDKHRAVTLRNRMVKVFSVNNLSHVSGNGMNGQQVRLTPQNSVCQFSSHINLPQGKGAHMWGKLQMEHESGELFEVNIPTVPLDSILEISSEHLENGPL